MPSVLPEATRTSADDLLELGRGNYISLDEQIEVGGNEFPSRSFDNQSQQESIEPEVNVSIDTPQPSKHDNPFAPAAGYIPGTMLRQALQDSKGRAKYVLNSHTLTVRGCKHLIHFIRDMILDAYPNKDA
jgi:hypothetical protein